MMMSLEGLTIECIACTMRRRRYGWQRSSVCTRRTGHGKYTGGSYHKLKVGVDLRALIALRAVCCTFPLTFAFHDDITSALRTIRSQHNQ